MEYVFEKRVLSNIKDLMNSGNVRAMRAGVQVSNVIMEINLKSKTPFQGLKMTNHGETRIKNCIKYDLKNGYRLITIQHKGVCTLIYTGDHEDCEKWLNTHRGYTLAIEHDSRTLVSFNKVIDINSADGRPFPQSDYSNGKLSRKLGDRYFDFIAEQISYKYLKPFLEFESICTEDEIIDACLPIKEEKIQELFLEVFYALRKGDIDAAKNLVLAYQDNLVLVEEASIEEKENIRSNDQFIKLTDLDPDFLRSILENSNWYDWMLFLHPLQRQVINQEMTGPSRLLGVSGSGKTCVLVHRARRLAKKYPGKKILLLTLNPSLATLIKELVTVLCLGENEVDIVPNIEVKSFWQLCLDLLSDLDQTKQLKWSQRNNTSKSSINIDDVWRRFYKHQTFNGLDSSSLFNLHQTLLARKIQPDVYLKQEFDWVRSAMQVLNRKNYIEIERTGRKIPILESDRKRVLNGLLQWERKMEIENVIDYLGLSSYLHQHLNVINPIYRCILVDEVQDFGTIELEIIRKIVPEQENDIFLTGDIAQQVYNKHHRLKQAGINISPANYKQILKNYRNSREILEASSSVFLNNVNTEDYRSEDFQILPPEYANFSSPKPFLRKADSLEDEVFCAVSYLEELFKTSPNRKGCIAFCGYTLSTVSMIAEQFKYPCLNGTTEIKHHQIVLSDLEQTKGFEFDCMIIINCNEIVFPNPRLPKEEWFRELSKLYVAMTRAKIELIISWSSNLSPVFSSSKSLFQEDVWEHRYKNNNYSSTIELHPSGAKILNHEDYLKMKLPEFLLTPAAIGMSRDLQNKLIQLVKGFKSFDSKGRQDGWQNMEELKRTIKSTRVDNPFMNSLFGASALTELKNFFDL